MLKSTSRFRRAILEILKDTCPDGMTSKEIKTELKKRGLTPPGQVAYYLLPEDMVYEEEAPGPNTEKYQTKYFYCGE